MLNLKKKKHTADAKKSVSSKLLSAIASFFLLFILGKLGDVRVMDGAANYSYFLLRALQLILFSSLWFAINQYIVIWQSSKQRNRIISFFLVIFFFFASFQLLSISPRGSYDAGFSYIGVGDYLRDTQHINIYYMDWSGWLGTMTFYCTGMLSWLGVYLLKNKFKK